MKEQYLSKTPNVTFVYLSKCNIKLFCFFGNSKNRFSWTGLLLMHHRLFPYMATHLPGAYILILPIVYLMLFEIGSGRRFLNGLGLMSRGLFWRFSRRSTFPYITRSSKDECSTGDQTITSGLQIIVIKIQIQQQTLHNEHHQMGSSGCGGGARRPRLCVATVLSTSHPTNAMMMIIIIMLVMTMIMLMNWIIIIIIMWPPCYQHRITNATMMMIMISWWWWWLWWHHFTRVTIIIIIFIIRKNDEDCGDNIPSNLSI